MTGLNTLTDYTSVKLSFLDEYALKQEENARTCGDPGEHLI